VIDTVIIGAGPAGLLAARRLARAGLDVTVLEEHAEIGAPTHCTGIVSAEMAELVKIPDSFVLGRPTMARLHGPGGAACQVGWSGPGREELLVIDRASFDRMLAEQAISAGAVVRTATPAEDLTVDAAGVTVRSGREHVRARACILACGVTYRFHRRLGLGLPARVIHTAQTEVSAEPSRAVELHFGRGVAPEGFVWVVPVLRDGVHRLKVGVIARGHAGAHLDRFLARPEIASRLTEPPSPAITRLLPLRPTTVSYARRVVAVGDAGGFTKPTTGGGIFYSLLTAALAADTLIEAAAAGWYDGAFLARYERRWQQRLRRELRAGDQLRYLLAKCTDAEIDTLVNALDARDVQAVIQRTARFNWHRAVILALLRQRGIASLLVRAMFR
jgi:digeranylgeranylglycerophospholipid reductase